MKIQIINGPNLNLLGRRERSIYGGEAFEPFFERLQRRFDRAVSLTYFQSNIEGELVDKLHEVGFSCRGIVLNAGAYTHTSIALHDAIAAIDANVIEVHISRVYAREEFRYRSIISSQCTGCISGLGLNGYALAIQHFVDECVSIT